MADLLISVLVSLDALVGAGWILVLFHNARELSTYRNFHLDEGPSTSDDEKMVVSVIVPARNEALMIGSCLTSIVEQTHRNLEIIVVDDQSTDGTAGAATSTLKGDVRATVVHGEELPEGWLGKSWACYQGFRVSRGEWLLFVDSDSVLARGAVERTLSYCQRRGKDALSIFPGGRLNGFWAKMVWPFMASLIRLLYPLRVINDRKGRSALAFGAFILIKRKAYMRMGGHEAVRADFVEDKRIGELLKEKGIPFGVLLDGGVITAGLAGGGLGAVWGSVKRIVSNPLRGRRATGLEFVISGLMLFVYPLLILLLALATPTVGDILRNLVVIAASISILSPAAIVTYDIRNTTSRSYAFAILALAAGTIVVLGILRQLIGGSSYNWRGRTYTLPPAREG